MSARPAHAAERAGRAERVGRAGLAEQAAPAELTDVSALPDLSDLSEELVKPSTTAKTLRRLRIWLVLTSLAAGAVTLFAFSRAHAAVDTISNRSAPAVEQADAAYVAISNADADAVRGLPHAGALSALSPDYYNQLAAANQSLSQLLADNVAGPAATSQLQLVQELVVGYNQQVEQAYADLAQDYANHVQQPDNTLAVVDLYYSTSLAGTLLDDLKTLRNDEAAALTAQQSSTWLAATGYLVWVPVIAAAVALVLATDALVRRRFRRRLNVGLAAAALALVAMGLLCGLSLWASDGDLSDGVNGSLVGVTALSDAQVAGSSDTWQAELYDQVTKACRNDGACGADVTKPAGTPPKTASTPAQQIHEIQIAEGGFAGAAAIADTAYIVRALIIAVLALAATALSVFGLWRRIDEYKFEA
jgi:hypothetical protein